MNYYERHIGDYLKDTAHLSLLEHGIYTRLLDVYYTREGALPDAQIARLVGARSNTELAALRAVLAEFFVQEDAGDWVQQRCEREIARFQDKQSKAKASANARWSQSGRNANASPDAMRTHSEGNAPSLQTPDTIEEREPTVLVAGTAYRPPPSPNAEIVELYRKHLPQLPGVEVLNDTRKRAIACRWREVCSDGKLDREAGLEWFAWYFSHAAKSKFLTGQIPGKSGRVWQADFDFLMNASKFPRVVEGSYHKDTA